MPTRKRLDRKRTTIPTRNPVPVLFCRKRPEPDLRQARTILALGLGELAKADASLTGIRHPELTADRKPSHRTGKGLPAPEHNFPAPMSGYLEGINPGYLRCVERKLHL